MYCSSVPSSFKPMLAATVSPKAREYETKAQFEALLAQNLRKLTFPMYATPKIDGVRVFIHPERGPVTRGKIAPVRNQCIHSVLNQPELFGLDGEIVVGRPNDPDIFNKTTGPVRSFAGKPEFTFWVFDQYHSDNPNTPYSDRFLTLKEEVDNGLHPSVKCVPYHVVQDLEELDVLNQRWLNDGYEGVMLRAPSGKYKFGRSTLREQGLVKVKEFLEEDAEVISFVPRYRNTNEQTRTDLGYAARSSHQEGMVAEEALGALICRGITGDWTGVEFRVGSGFDDQQRLDIWRNREAHKGRILSYTYQPVGSVEKPRSPIFRNFRAEDNPVG